MKMRIFTSLFLFFILGCTVTGTNSDFREKLQLTTTQGDQVNMDDMDDKYLLVNFWATWCKPCIREMPLLKELEAEMDNDKMEFIFISDEDPSHVSDFIRNRKLDIESYIMKDAVETYGLMYLPTTYIVDPDGKILMKQEGEEDWSSDAMKKKISALIR